MGQASWWKPALIHTGTQGRRRPVLCAAMVQAADLCMNQFIFFLILLAIPLEVLLYLCFLFGRQQAVRPVPPAELQKALSLGPAKAQLHSSVTVLLEFIVPHLSRATNVTVLNQCSSQPHCNQAPTSSMPTDKSVGVNCRQPYKQSPVECLCG